MKNGWTQQRKRRMTYTFIGIGLLLGIVYPVMSREYEDPIAIINGLIIGLLGSLFLSFFEFYMTFPLNKKMRFAKKVVFKTLVYSFVYIFIILAVCSVTRSIYSGIPYFEYIYGTEFQNFIFREDLHIIVAYTMVSSTVIIFIHQLSIKMGQGVLLDLIFGKYHEPREEHRVFMFLDLNHSTTIAEKMGLVEYNQFLNDFFHDITDAILASNGQIYRYVGDEVVVTWQLKDGFSKVNCFYSFLEAQKAISNQSEKYLNQYGVVPQFSAGFHFGRVIVGQIGDVKSQIVFNGKVLYEGAQIEKQCRYLKRKHLISEALMKYIPIPEHSKAHLAGTVTTRDEQEIKLFYISQD